MPKFNDLELSGEKWKERQDIIDTDSLWIINERAKWGKRSNFYHGNFVPQIPNQLILRYTKKWWWVYDPFLWSATTAIECENLERNIIWVDIQQELIDRANKLIDSEKIKKHILKWDSSSEKTTNTIKRILKEEKIKKVDLAILHPPYYDIVKFSEDKKDLSNTKNLKDFLNKFKKVLKNTNNLLKKDGYIAIVIWDKYTAWERMPLWFLCMAEAQKVWFILKSIVVKNMEGNRWKQWTGWIWRYRALNSDYFIFKHEYILIFKK